MKTITISDKDFDTLMELSSELQTQANHHQAFPYYWEPASEKLELNYHNEGEVAKLFDWNQSESYTPEDYAESFPEFYDSFLRVLEVPFDTEDTDQAYDQDLESEWVDYITENKSVDAYSEDWKQKVDHNPSLFLSDVKGYIEGNKHHLGRNPHTYANTVQRMPKMKNLIEIICRINPQPEKNINHEARRFVLKSD